jgi:hypothetical protein
VAFLRGESPHEFSGAYPTRELPSIGDCARKIRCFANDRLFFEVAFVVLENISQGFV